MTCSTFRCHEPPSRADPYQRRLRVRFEAGDVAGLVDERAISQLATIRYSYNARGQLVIESKEDARKRGVKSPDRAEAIMLAFADMEPGIIKYYENRVFFTIFHF